MSTLAVGPFQRQRGLLSAALLWLALWCCLAWGAGFTVISASTRLVGDTYLLNARLEYRLSEVTLEALQNGVALPLLLEMEVRRRRQWLWDDTVASLQQPLRLEYHALTNRYLVTNENTGRQSYPSLAAALTQMGEIRNFPLIDAALIAPDEVYYGRLRTRLDIEALPSPLRPTAYLSGDWRLTSQWYEWPLQP